MSWPSSNRNTRKILLTGSAYETTLRLFKNLLMTEFGTILDNFDTKTESVYQIVSTSTLIYKKCSLNRAFFDLDSFKSECEHIEPSLSSIVCLENLNPRAETLIEDIKILRRVFSASFLRSHLIILLTLSNENSKSLRQLREGFEHFDVVFKYLEITSAQDRREFVASRVWLLEEVYYGPLRRIFRTLVDKNVDHVGSIQQALSAKYDEISQSLGGIHEYAPIKRNYNASNDDFKNEIETSPKKNDQNIGPRAEINQYNQCKKGSYMYHEEKQSSNLLPRRQSSGQMTNRTRSKSLYSYYQKAEVNQIGQIFSNQSLAQSETNAKYSRLPQESTQKRHHIPNISDRNLAYDQKKTVGIISRQYDWGSVSSAYNHYNNNENQVNNKSFPSNQSEMIVDNSEFNPKENEFKNQQLTFKENQRVKESTKNILPSKSQYLIQEAGKNVGADNEKSLLNRLKGLFDGFMWYMYLSSKNKIDEAYRRYTKKEYLNLILLGSKSHEKTAILNALKSKDTVTHELEDIIFCAEENVSDDKLYMKRLVESKNDLLNKMPINAFVMVIKFDQNQNDDEQRDKMFLSAAKKFTKCFGSEAIKSLIVLCIGNANNENLDAKIRESSGFKYLQTKHPHTKYCLWENIYTDNTKQREKFYECLSGLEMFTQDHMRLALSSVENQLDF